MKGQVEGQDYPLNFYPEVFDERSDTKTSMSWEFCGHFDRRSGVDFKAAKDRILAKFGLNIDDEVK